ncbi:glucose-6-phosphate dehydrogenase [Candidatus Poribacteria bacterium]|nr:glucose-6-phosphate dehydrogenase [Candidatus Poribacteria bacterium]
MAKAHSNPLRAGTPPRKTAPPCLVVVFGATGDLTARKLMPALFNLSRDGHLPQRFAIAGVARREKSGDSFREEMGQALHKYSRAKPESKEDERDFLQRVHYHATNFDDLSGYESLGRRLDEIERAEDLPGNRLYYLATSPEYFATAAENLGRAGLVRPVDPAAPAPWTRLIVEKPFGTDLSSARELNRNLRAVFDESQLYRIDHYLGKETVQNLLAFRFANAIFEPLWSSRYVEQVQVTVSEELGMEGRRGQYYDTAGALRDMVQNHILQLLCLTAIEAPASLDAESLRDEKVRLLRAIAPMTPDDVARNTVRGQYGPGSMRGAAVRGYREEELVNPESVTETYVALRLEVRNWRWAGVPFLLRTGKRLPKRGSEIAIIFKHPPHEIFVAPGSTALRHNTLVLRIQPDEGISLGFEAKQPGVTMRLQDVKMEFRYGTSFGQASPEAYERLLLDALSGDPSLFTRSDEVDQAWRLISSIHEGWAALPPPVFPNYAAGTWGPEEASRLVEGVSGNWRRL